MSSRGRVTRKANKDAHPGKIVAPRARKSNKDAQTERDATAAAKATISVTQKGQVKAVAALEDAMTIDNENEDSSDCPACWYGIVCVRNKYTALVRAGAGKNNVCARYRPFGGKRVYSSGFILFILQFPKQAGVEPVFHCINSYTIQYEEDHFCFRFSNHCCAIVCSNPDEKVADGYPPSGA